VVVAPNRFDEVEVAAELRLVEAHQAGDPNAFSLIVRDHYPMLLAQARRRLSSREEAEDAVQETLLRAFRAFPRFGGEYRVGAWLSRILSNVCADAGSQRMATDRLTERAAATQDRPHDDIGVGSDPQVMKSISTAMGQLPDSQRNAFFLREVADFSYGEVANHMGISEDNARARVHRARSALQQALSASRGALAGVLALPTALHAGYRRLASHGNAVPSSRTSSVTPTVAGSSGTLSNAVGQITASPLGQAVISVVPSMPKSSILLGVAASVASVTGLVATSLPTPAAAVSHAVVASAIVAPAVPTTAAPSPADTAPAPPSAPTDTAPAAPTTTSNSVATTRAPAVIVTPTAPTWIGTGASSAGAVAAPPAYCPAVTALDPTPAGAFSTPAPFQGTSVSGLTMGATDLITTGDSQGFSTSSSYANQDGSTTTVNARVGACLPPTDGALFVSLTDAAGDEVDLTGGYVETIGDASDQGYLFRGSATIVNNTGTSGTPFGATSEFVAQVEIVQPDNTAALTVAFFAPPPAPATDPTATPPDAGTSAGTSTTPPDAGATGGVTTTTPPESSATDPSSTPPDAGTNSSTVAPSLTASMTVDAAGSSSSADSAGVSNASDAPPPDSNSLVVANEASAPGS
jgi:RNA polymerase sigma-70 factor (ECF subfamily)